MATSKPSTQRLPMTAEKVALILDYKLNAKMPIKEIAASMSTSVSTISSWGSPLMWAKENLSARLAKLPQYADFREHIQDRAHQLGLFQGDLPPANEKTLERLTAKTFASALEMIAERPETRMKGYFFDHITAELGENARSLANIISVKGKVLRTSLSVMNLPGFQNERHRIAAALTRLDQHDKAKELLTEDARRSTVATASVFVDVLREIAGKTGSASTPRSINLVTLSEKYGLSQSGLGRLIAPTGILRAKPTQLAALPGYDEHFEALREALRNLGQNMAAEALKHPTMDATAFLQACRRNFDAVLTLVSRMAADPSRLRAEEATQLGLVPSVAEVLFNQRGDLRDANAVRDRLRALAPDQEARVADFLARFSAQHQGLASVAAPQGSGVSAPDAGMKRIHLERGGLSAPTRVVLVQLETHDPGPNKKHRLKRIYKSNPELVQAPRSYAADRSRQALRWLSTVLKRQFPESLEVQCYYDTERHTIVVSPNTKGKAISKFLKENGLPRLLGGEESAPNTKAATARDKEKADALPPSREIRHYRKLQQSLASATPGDDPAAKILAAITEGRL